MEYHQDRFNDYSLMVKKGEKIVAVLPANLKENELYSHQGLTYGGLLLSRKLKLADTLIIFKNLLEYLEKEDITTLNLKQIPSFYTQQPSEEVEYLLHLTQAEIDRVDTASVIALDQPLPIQSNRMEGVKKALKLGLVIKEESDFKDFWQHILLPNLSKRHRAQPTHTLTEIELLYSRFPNNIRQFNVYDGQTIVGGATIFETATTAHVQYISGDDRKQELGTLDFLFHHLITDIFKEKRYFDFGISNENQGKHLNKGLSYWKECFGARTFVHRCYSVKTKNHSLLNDVLI